MNFNIIEGATVEIDFNQFKEDYLNSSLKSDEVRLKYNLSKKQYSILSKKIRDELGIDKRPYAQSKHFYQQGNRWYIIKTHQKERIYFGSLPCSVFSKEDMEIIVEKCKEMSWNIGRCMNLIQSLGGNTNV